MNKKFYYIIFFLLIGQIDLFAQSPLKAKLDAMLEEEILKTSEAGISVYDLTADSLLYSYQDKKLYRPASVQKLLTGITALSRFGKGHLFSTELYYTGEIRKDTLQGDLYVVGGFDSEFRDPNMNDLVQMIADKGIKHVNGKILADVSMTDSIYWGPGWSWDDTPYYFQPYLSPLMFHKGYVEVTVSPGAKDSLAQVTCVPASSYYSICNKTVSNNNAAGKLQVTRNWLENGNVITLTGNVEYEKTERVNMYTSKDFFMSTFVERLRNKGLSVPNYSYGELPSDSTARFLAKVSHPLHAVLLRAMKNSDNLSAEALLFHLARLHKDRKHVSESDGVTEINEMMKEMQIDPAQYNIVDGCGVSLYNYISPELLVSFLRYAYSQKEVFKELYDTLPIAGIDGTLRNRMKEGNVFSNVRAKTGSVTGVSSLAGYAKAANGHLIAFSVINQNVMDQDKAKHFQDKISQILCE